MAKYPHPVLALESLDEIRDWACGRERFNFVCQLKVYLLTKGQYLGVPLSMRTNALKINQVLETPSNPSRILKLYVSEAGR